MRHWVLALAFLSIGFVTPVQAQTEPLLRALNQVCLPFTQFDVSLAQAVAAGRQIGFSSGVLPPDTRTAYWEIRTADGGWSLLLQEKQPGAEHLCAVRRTGNHVRLFEQALRPLMTGTAQWSETDDYDYEPGWTRSRQVNGRRLFTSVSVLEKYVAGAGGTTEMQVSGRLYPARP